MIYILLTDSIKIDKASEFEHLVVTYVGSF